MPPRKLDLMALDCGNAQIKVVTQECSDVFPHALKLMTQADIHDNAARNEMDNNPNVFCVNGTYYKIGEKALRKGRGSALYGEDRYVETYYGVLAAIAAFKSFSGSRKSVYIYGSHTPKDIDYRPDLIASVKRKWVVESMGQKKVFEVVGAAGIDEPVAAYRHAILSDDGTSFRNLPVLREKSVFILDVGGFTIGVSVAEGGKVDYSAASSDVVGMLDVLEEFEKLIRKNNRLKLKGTNALNPMRLRAALKSGVYDAAGLGEIRVAAEANEACDLLLNEIANLFKNYGGAGEYHAVLLAGGGGALMEKRIKDMLRHPSVHVVEEKRELMHMATALGGMKILRLLESKGKL